MRTRQRGGGGKRWFLSPRRQGESRGAPRAPGEPLPAVSVPESSAIKRSAQPRRLRKDSVSGPAKATAPGKVSQRENQLPASPRPPGLAARRERRPRGGQPPPRRAPRAAAAPPRHADRPVGDSRLARDRAAGELRTRQSPGEPRGDPLHRGPADCRGPRSRETLAQNRLTHGHGLVCHL